MTLKRNFLLRSTILDENKLDLPIRIIIYRIRKKSIIIVRM